MSPHMIPTKRGRVGRRHGRDALQMRYEKGGPIQRISHGCGGYEKASILRAVEEVAVGILY